MWTFHEVLLNILFFYHYLFWLFLQLHNVKIPGQSDSTSELVTVETCLYILLSKVIGQVPRPLGQLHVQSLNYTRKIIFDKLLKKVILSWLAKKQVLFLNIIKSGEVHVRFILTKHNWRTLKFNMLLVNLEDVFTLDGHG